MKLIDKSTLVAEIERRKLNHIDLTEFNSGYKNAIFDILSILDDLEVKEADLEEEDIKNAFKAGYELGLKTKGGEE